MSPNKKTKAITKNLSVNDQAVTIGKNIIYRFNNEYKPNS